MRNGMLPDPMADTIVEEDQSGAGLKGEFPRIVYLHPAEVFASNQPTRISMVLGSCVGIFLFDRRRHIGGAAHYMLPKWDGVGRPSPRYGDAAINTLIAKLQNEGSKIGSLQAKVFGGACMFQAFRSETGYHIGLRNIEIAMELLSHRRISIVSTDVGGDRGRRVKLLTDTGAAYTSIIGERDGQPAPTYSE